MRPPEVMAYCYPQIKLTAMPETPSHPAGWVKVEAPPCFQGLEAVQVFVRAYEQEIWEELLKMAVGKE